MISYKQEEKSDLVIITNGIPTSTIHFIWVTFIIMAQNEQMFSEEFAQFIFRSYASMTDQ